MKAGLVPQHLADIFIKTDEACDKRPSRCITGVRVLTSNEYVEMMREKDRKEKEAAEQKQKRKEERVEEKGEGRGEKNARERKKKKRRDREEGKERSVSAGPHLGQTMKMRPATSLIRHNMKKTQTVKLGYSL